MSRLLCDARRGCYWPTHGPAIPDPMRYVQAFIAPRLTATSELV